MPDDVDPLSIACPNCKAPVGKPCVEAATGRRVGTHYSRSFVAEDLARRTDSDPEIRIPPLRDYDPIPDPVPARKPPF